MEFLPTQLTSPNCTHWQWIWCKSWSLDEYNHWPMRIVGLIQFWRGYGGLGGGGTGRGAHIAKPVYMIFFSTVTFFRFWVTHCLTINYNLFFKVLWGSGFWAIKCSRLQLKYFTTKKFPTPPSPLLSEKLRNWLTPPLLAADIICEQPLIVLQTGLSYSRDTLHHFISC